MKIDELELQLLELPKQIREKNLQLLGISIEVEKLRKEIKQIEDGVDVCVSLDPELTNDAKRKVAKKSALAVIADYIKHQNALSILEVKVTTERTELEYLHNLFRAYLAIAGLQGVK